MTASLFVTATSVAWTGRDPRDADAPGPDLVHAVAKPVVDGLVSALLEQRAQARARKDWPAADAVRDTLKTLGLKVADTPAGPRWSLEN